MQYKYRTYSSHLEVFASILFIDETYFFKQKEF